MSGNVHADDAYFIRTGAHTFRATRWTSGAWKETEQHFSPLGGLVVHAVEQFVAARGEDGMQIARITFDILGVVAIADVDIDVAVVRAGRTVELLEATVTWNGRAVVRARIWRLARTDTRSVADGAGEVFPEPGSLESWNMTGVWPGDYVRSLDVRAICPPEPGRGAAWIRSDIALVAGESVSPLAHYIRLVDTANGVAVRASPREWMYPNVGLTIHLHRQPHGEWVGLDTTVAWGPEGLGLTSTVLHDTHGPVGHALQSLTVRPMPSQ